MRNDKPLTIKLSIAPKRAKPAVPVPGSVKRRHKGWAGFKFTLLLNRAGVAHLCWLFSAPLAALTWLIDVATNFTSFSCLRCVFSFHTPPLLLSLRLMYNVTINPGSTMSPMESVLAAMPVWFPSL